MFVEKLHKITAQELGCTEDDFNNFLIDMWQLSGKIVATKPEIKSVQDGKTVTVTITQDCWYKQ